MLVKNKFQFFWKAEKNEKLCKRCEKNEKDVKDVKTVWKKVKKVFVKRSFCIDCYLKLNVKVINKVVIYIYQPSYCSCSIVSASSAYLISLSSYVS